MPSVSQIASASYPAVLAEMRKPHDQWSENAALRLLEKHGFIKRKSLGENIEVPIDYQANSEAGVLATSLTAVDLTTNPSIISAAVYDIAEVGVPVKWTMKEEAQNPSTNQKIALVKSKLENGINSHDDVLEQALFAASTSGLLGWLTLIADDGQGTVGGIDSGSDAFWRNQVGTRYNSDGSDQEAIFTEVYNACLKGTGSTMGPKLMISGAEAHSLFESTQQANQRYVDSQDFKVGAKTLAFKNALFGFSQYGDHHVYFLNPGAFQIIMSKEYNRHQGETQEQDARFAYVLKLYTALQNVVLNRSRLGVAEQTT